MPKASSSKSSSSDDRKRLGIFIRANGEIMPRACSNCRRLGRVCKVHVRSGRCSECNIHGLKGCDIKITASEWERLSKERAKLLSQIQDARLASAAAMDREREIVARAREATSTALAKEERLAKQLELLDRRADNAVSVAEANALEAEAEERSLSSLPEGVASLGPELALSPFTWANDPSLDSSDFFAGVSGTLRFDPSLFVDPGGSVAGAGSSS